MACLFVVHASSSVLLTVQTVVAGRLVLSYAYVGFLDLFTFVALRFGLCTFCLLGCALACWSFVRSGPPVLLSACVRPVVLIHEFFFFSAGKTI